MALASVEKVTRRLWEQGLSFLLICDWLCVMLDTSDILFWLVVIGSKQVVSLNQVVLNNSKYHVVFVSII